MILLHCTLALLKNYNMCLIFALKYSASAFCCRTFQRRPGNPRFNSLIRQNKAKFPEKLRLKGLYCLLCTRNYALCLSMLTKLVGCPCVMPLLLSENSANPSASCTGTKYLLTSIKFAFIMNCSCSFYKYFTPLYASA